MFTYCDSLIVSCKTPLRYDTDSVFPQSANDIVGDCLHHVEHINVHKLKLLSFVVDIYASTYTR